MKISVFISLLVCFLVTPCMGKNIPEVAQQTQVKDLEPGHFEYQIHHNGLERKYILYVPDSYDKAKPSPLVITIHGGGGDALSAALYFDFKEKADQVGALVAYPEGTGDYLSGKLIGTWNGGNCCGYAQKNNIDDVGFLDAMIEKIKIDYNTDTNRIYATGMSNGAIMSYRLACELSDKIAAIAPHSSIGHFTECNLSRSVPTLHIHGKDDPCASYDGCTECESCMVNFFNKYYGECLSLPVNLEPADVDVVSVPTFLDSWREKNGCSVDKYVSWQNGQSYCETYSQCGKGEVTLCTVDGGHTWAGRENYSPQACDLYPDGCICQAWKDAVGALCSDLNANDMIWEFFKKHSLLTRGSYILYIPGIMNPLKEK